MMKSYKLILFDADGTLFDFDTAEKTAFSKTMRSFGIKGSLDQLHSEYEQINKALWMEFQQNHISSKELRIKRFRKFFLKQNINLDPIEVSPVYLTNLAAGTDLLPDAEEIVNYCQTRCTIALATNGLTEVQRPRFASSALADYFRHIFISEEIGYPKPTREYFDHIFTQLPFQNSAMIIGDNLSSDIAGGNSAGIDTCWFNPAKIPNNTEIKPDFEICHLSELKKIIG